MVVLHAGIRLQIAKAAVELYKQCMQEDYSSVLRWRADAERIASRIGASQRQVVSVLLTNPSNHARSIKQHPGIDEHKSCTVIPMHIVCDMDPS